MIKPLSYMLQGSTIFLLANLAFAEPSADDFKRLGTPGELRILQNRFFSKTWRPELSLSLTTLLNDAYTDTQGTRSKLRSSHQNGGG